jgi:predicted AAA+ superfamily ATPase
MANPEIYPRVVEPRLDEALADTPVVLIHGPRQYGKTTLAHMVGAARGYAYFSFDDDVALAAAREDPVGFVGDLPERAILDEVQRVPELFTALKSTVDRDRGPGRFLLTGSANVLLVPKLADPLAGRMEILRLHPLAQVELARSLHAFLGALFGVGFDMGAWPRLRDELPERIVAGGYSAALARQVPRRRAAWYRDYMETLVERDVRDLARIRWLDALPRLLMLRAGQTARLLNVSDLASPFQLSRQTIRDYVTLLTRVFLLDELPPWHSNRLRRLINTQAAPGRYRPCLCAAGGGCGDSEGGSCAVGSTAGDLRVSGIAPSGKWVGGCRQLPPFPRQGRCGGGHRAGNRRPASAWRVSRSRRPPR